MTYNYILETEQGDIKLELEVTHAEPYRAAKLTGHPDTWCPAEGGDIDYDVVSIKPNDSAENLHDCEYENIIKYINALEEYIDLQSRCLDFDATETENELILEFLEKCLNDEGDES